jgi:hypothetical protein
MFVLPSGEELRRRNKPRAARRILDAPGQGRGVRPSPARPKTSKMKLPVTLALMKAANYTFVEKKTCVCGAAVELWRAPIAQAYLLNPMSTDDARPQNHFATCAMAVQFRRRSKAVLN